MSQFSNDLLPHTDHQVYLDPIVMIAMPEGTETLTGDVYLTCRTCNLILREWEVDEEGENEYGHCAICNADISDYEPTAQLCQTCQEGNQP